MDFELSIELNNAAMQTGYELGEALRQLADKLSVVGGLEGQELSGIVRDDNGNTVGRWEVKS